MNNPMMAEKLVAQALQLFQSGGIDRAVPLLQQALASDPGCHQAHYLLGVVAQQAERLPAAEDHFLAALDAAPGEGGYLAALAAMLLQQGRIADASVRICMALAHAPQDAAVLELAGDISFHAGDRKAAIIHYRSAVAAGADPARMSRKIGRGGEDETVKPDRDRTVAFEALHRRAEAAGIGKIVDVSPVAAIFAAENIEELSAAGDRWERRERMAGNRPSAVVSPVSDRGRERFADLNTRLDPRWWQKDDLRGEKF
jgi:tetratricopeptide (TPR) repeat protein